MFDRLRHVRGDRQNGFTLIELLVVVVIIGILIAIAVPLYLNYRTGAYDKAAGNDLRGTISLMEKCFSDNSDKYPDAIPEAGGNPTGDTCTSSKVVLSTNSKIQYVVRDDKKAYIARTLNTGGGKVYCFASVTGGAVKGTKATAFPTATYADSC